MSDEKHPERPRVNTADSLTYDLLKGHSRQMRREPTLAENHLWSALRSRQVQGLTFRRQHAIGPFIVDFFCLEHRLIIEVDGGIHQEVEQQQYDEARTIWLEAQGYQVIRFTNEQVLHALPIVLESIVATIAANK